MRSAACAAMLLSAVAAWSPKASADDWTCYTYNPQETIYKGLEEIGKRIGEITKGRVTVTCHPAGSLGIAAADITGAVSDGVVTLASNAFITGSVPMVGVFSLPGLFATEEELYKGMAIMKPYIDAQMAQQGLVYVGAYNYPRQVIFSTDIIKSLADLKGKKIRVASVEQAEFATRFGGSPVTIGTADVAPALQLGTVSVVLTAASGGARLWQDLLKSNYVIGPNFTVSPVIINADAWGTLSADEQQQVLAAVAEVTKGMTDSLREDNAKMEAQYKSKGMEINSGTPEEEKQMIETLKDYWPQWAKERGDEAQKALDEVRAALGK
jgi:TRAP-type C4-dicarboxylate transport system substrate-binding protein